MNGRSSTADAAWAFLLDFYRHSGVSEACLVLQDQAGLDVVEMLMLVYADVVLGKLLPGSEIAALRAETAGWREDVVIPLRAVRRKLKPARRDIAESAKEALRADIKKAELSAERLQVDFIADWLERATSGGPALATTLAGLVREGGQNSHLKTALELILTAAQTARRAGPGATP